MTKINFTYTWNLKNMTGANSNKYQIDFDFTTTGTLATMAEGFSYSLGENGTSIIPDPVGINAENGTGTKVRLSFVAAPVTAIAGSNAPGIYLLYNGTSPATNEATLSNQGVVGYSNNVTWKNTANNHITISIDSLGFTTVTLNSNIIFG